MANPIYNLMKIGIVLALAITSALEVEGANVTGDSSIFDDRININHNLAHAHAYNKDGSLSASNSESLGYTAGILQGNHYRPLGSQTSSKSNTYSTGRRPPSTFANTGAVARPYGIHGNAGAGFSGGRGNAYTQSHNQQVAIPIGFGAVLLSNLRPLNATKNAIDSNSNSEHSSIFSKSVD